MERHFIAIHISHCFNRKCNIKLIFITFSIILVLLLSQLIEKDVYAYTSNVNVILSVPYEPQWDTKWCGLATLSMILRYYGYYVHSWDLAYKLPYGWGLPKNRGVSPLQLVKYIQDNYENLIVKVGKYGNSTDYIFKDILSNITNQYPVIINILNPKNILQKHSVVVCGINSTGIFIHDPSGWFTKKLLGIDKDPPIYVYVNWNTFKKYILTVDKVKTEYQLTTIAIQGIPNPPAGSLSLFKFRIIDDDNRYLYLDYDKGLRWKLYNHPLFLDGNDTLELSSYLTNHINTKQNYIIEFSIKDDKGYRYYYISYTISVKSHSALICPLVRIKLDQYLIEEKRYFISISLFDRSGKILDHINIGSLLYEPTGTMLILKDNDQRLFLHLYNYEGDHVGIDYKTKNVEIKVPGCWYYDNYNGIIYIYVPPHLNNFIYLIDAIYAKRANVNFTLNILYLDKGKILNNKTIESIIYKNKYVMMDVKIHPLINDIYIKPKPLLLKISEPVNYSVFITNKATVKWRIIPGTFNIINVELKVDNRPWIDVTNKDSYIVVGLREGKHIVKIRVIDMAGNKIVKTALFYVKYSDRTGIESIICIIILSIIFLFLLVNKIKGRKKSKYKGTYTILITFLVI